jgi:transcriptional regulator with XRE-family HTH domain
MSGLGPRLRELRQSLKMTQDEVAKCLGISRTTYANYERGHREPDNQMLVQLAECYQVSTDYLLGVQKLRSG